MQQRADRALDARDLEFLQHLPEMPPHAAGPAVTPPPPTDDFRPHPAVQGELHDHDWGAFATSLSLTPRASAATAAAIKVEDSEETALAAVSDEMLDAPPLRRSKWTRRLVITKQPASEFYKDEGGKANALDVEVSLIEFNELGESARSPDDEFIDIPLRILLFFEDGKRVDDADQEIFRFVGNEYDSVVIRTATRKAAVQFRLEKVSRRKDGKRFRLRIEVDQEQCTANVADLSPIFTNAICVLSKRKHHAPAADSLSRAKEPPLKLLKRDLQRMEEKLEARVDALMEEMRRMSRQVQLQSELLGKIFMPTTTPSAAPLLPADNTTMEWFLKSGLMDDMVVRPHGLPPTALPYFSMTDESEDRDDPRSSPSSSDASGVDMAPPPPHLPPHSSSSSRTASTSSVLTFAEF